MQDNIAKPGQLKVCYGTSNPELGRRILKCLVGDYPHVEVQLQTKRFADGEICTEYSSSIRGCCLYIVQSICRPNVNANLMELILAIDAAKRASVDHVTAVIPYYGYARQDRKAKMRQPISARVVADMLTTVGVNHVITVDIHVQQIQGFFSGNVPLDFLPGHFIFIDILKRIARENSQLVIASTDAGGASRCRDVASHLHAGLAIIDKRRKSNHDPEVMNVIGEVEGCTVIIYDDICDTANSLCNAAAALRSRGATTVYGCVTHPVLSKDALENIKNSCFKTLYVSDTIPVTDEMIQKSGNKLQVCEAAEIIAQCIRHNHRQQSFGEYMIQCDRILEESEAAT